MGCGRTEWRSLLRRANCDYQDLITLVADTPSFALMPNGDMVVSVTSTDSHAYFANIGELGVNQNFTEDTTGWELHIPNLIFIYIRFKEN